MKVTTTLTDYHSSKFLSLLDKSRNAAVLDSWTSKALCGESWFNLYPNSLKSVKSEIQFSDSSNQYKFGDNTQVTTTTAATIPIIIGTTKVKMNVEIIPRNIPLLLSHDSMKHAKIQLNFENNTIRAFQKSINLTFTRSGHYAVPITNPKHMLNDVNSSNQHNDTPWYDRGLRYPLLSNQVPCHPPF